jgi:MFS transporter, DHA1 family, inner membrane transport protein
MESKEKIILLLLTVLNFTHILDFMIMMPLGNYLMPYFDITSQQFSMLVAAYTFSAGASGFLAAFFVDGFDRKKVLLFAYAGFLLGTLFCAISPAYEILLVSRIVAGLFGGLIGAQVLSIVADIVPYERRAAAMGMIMAAFSAASVFGVPFGLYIANLFNWHAPFFFVVILGILLVPFLIKFLPKMDRHLHEKTFQKIGPAQLVGDVFRNSSQLYALALTAVLMMGHFMIIPFINPFMEFNMGFSKTQTPLIYMVGGALTMVTSPLLGRLADRLGKYNLFIFLALASIPLIALITNLPAIPFYFVLCITGLWFIISAGRFIPAQAMVSNVVPTERRGSFMSFNSSVQQLFVGLASVLAGLIVVKMPDNRLEHYEITGYLSIALILFSLFIATMLNKKLKEKKNETAVSNKEELAVVG